LLAICKEERREKEISKLVFFSSEACQRLPFLWAERYSLKINLNLELKA
jgi:hypothetical protein